MQTGYTSSRPFYECTYFTVNLYTDIELVSARFRKQPNLTGDINYYLIIPSDGYSAMAIAQALDNALANSSAQFEASWQSTYYLRTDTNREDLNAKLNAVKDQIAANPQEFIERGFSCTIS